MSDGQQAQDRDDRPTAERVAHLAKACRNGKDALERFVSENELEQRVVAPLVKMSEAQYSNVKNGHIAEVPGRSWVEERIEHVEHLREALVHLRSRADLYKKKIRTAAFFVSEPMTEKVETTLVDRITQQLKQVIAEGTGDLPTIYSSPTTFRQLRRTLEDVAAAFPTYSLRELFKGVVLRTTEPRLCRYFEKERLMEPFWKDMVQNCNELARRADTRFSPALSTDPERWLRIGTYWPALPPIHGFYMEGTHWKAKWLHVGVWAPNLETGVLCADQVLSVTVHDVQGSVFTEFRDALQGKVGATNQVLPIVSKVRVVRGAVQRMKAAVEGKRRSRGREGAERGVNKGG